MILAAAPAAAQTIEFAGEGVFVGTGGAGAFANPNIGAAAPGACIDTTDFGLCQ